MKNLYTLLVALLISFTINAQIINFPDARLKQMLVSGYNVDISDNGNLWMNQDADTNNDGEIDVNEAQAVVGMKINNFGGPGELFNIVSLEGLQYFTNLEHLDCGFNSITSLDPISQLPLETLWCFANPITYIDFSNLTNLKWLRAQYLNLSSLDVSNLINLERLIYHGTGIASLDLENLVNLQEIDCSNNNVTSLDFLSHLDQLRVLKFNNSSISNIDLSLFPDLEELDFGNNELTEIDLLPVPNLTHLLCENNQLTELDISHLTNLYWIDFSDNFLTSFDTNGVNHINYIFGSNNLLRIVSVKDGYSPSNIDFYVEYGADYNFGGNPLELICVDPFTLEVGYFSGGTYNVGTYCTFTPGGDYNTLQGQAFFDNDADGCDEADVVLPNLLYHISSNFTNGSVISNDLGEYAFYLGDNTYTIYPILENPSYYNVSPENPTVNFPAEASPFTQDFCITPNGTINDLEITIIPLGASRPGFDASYKVVYKNKGTTTLSGDIDFGFQDEFMEFVSSIPANESGLTDLLSYSFTDLLPFESREIIVTMNLNTPMDTNPLNGGEVLTFSTSIESSEIDETPDDNTFELHQTVVNSYDPNDKTCLEGEYITPEMVGEYVHYMIRFENTGTADAINIVVKDDIDRTKYNLTTLVPLDASHDYVARIKNNASNYYIEFIFENINLPFDDANNDGYIVFKIKTLDTLELNDTFENDAEIYFDFNFPIITNNESTTVGTLSTDEFELANNSISIYPNPTTNQLTLESKQAIKQISIFDISGRRIKEIAVIGTKTELTISTEALSTGTYFVKIKTETSEVVKKIIKD